MVITTNVDDRRLYGIILSAGEGRRLQRYVQELGGEPLPKQYVNLIGRRSMIEHTFHRAEKLISAERILTVVDRGHRRRSIRRETWNLDVNDRKPNGGT